MPSPRPYLPQPHGPESERGGGSSKTKRSPRAKSSPPRIVPTGDMMKMSAVAGRYMAAAAAGGRGGGVVGEGVIVSALSLSVVVGLCRMRDGRAATDDNGDFCLGGYQLLRPS